MVGDVGVPHIRELFNLILKSDELPHLRKTSMPTIILLHKKGPKITSTTDP